MPEAEFPKGWIFAIDSQDQFEEDPVAPSSSNLFCKDAFVVIKPGYQPSRLPESPFFLGKCKNNVKASERKLTVSIYTQDQLLPLNFVDAQLQCQIEISGILHKAENVELRMMSWHWMKMNIVVVSLIVWTMGIRQQHESQLRLEKMCQKRQKHLIKSFKCDPQRQQCEPHGLDEHRDPEINHYTCSTIDTQISTLTNDTNVSMVD